MHVPGSPSMPCMIHRRSMATSPMARSPNLPGPAARSVESPCRGATPSSLARLAVAVRRTHGAWWMDGLMRVEDGHAHAGAAGDTGEDAAAPVAFLSPHHRSESGKYSTAATKPSQKLIAATYPFQAAASLHSRPCSASLLSSTRDRPAHPRHGHVLHFSHSFLYPKLLPIHALPPKGEIGACTGNSAIGIDRIQPTWLAFANIPLRLI
nr:unnamed protein product [Digitaria exilis]